MTHLEYRLEHLNNPKDAFERFAFQQVKVTDEVVNFLKKKNYYDETTGWRVALGNAYPEVKDSLNVIYLTSKAHEKFDKVDITRTVGLMQLNNRMTGVHKTLRNFVKAVKKAAGKNQLKQGGVYSA